MATITEKLKWLIDADASSAIKGFKAAGDSAEKELTRAEGAGKNLGGQLTKVGAGAVALSGIVGSALVKAAGSFEDLALKAGHGADATGLTVDQASRWIEVSGDMGIGFDTVESAIGKMNKTLGSSPGKFEELGIKVATTKGGIEDVNGTFLNVITRLNEIEDPAARAAAAASIFGKGWQDQAELLKLSTDDIKTQLQSVSDQKVISEEELQKAKDYRADLDHLKDSAEDLALAIGQGAAPIIGVIASAVGSAVEAFTSLDGVSHGAAGGILAAGTAAAGTVGAFALIAGQAIKIKSRFTDAEGALTTFGKVGIGVAGAVGLATIVLTGIYADNAAKKARLVGLTNEFVDSLKAEEGGTKGAVAANVAKDLSDKDLIANAKQLGLSVQDLADIVTGKTVPAYEELKKQSDNMVGPFARNRQDWNDNAVAISELKQKIDPMTTALRDAKDQMVANKQVSDDLGTSTDEYKDTTEDATAATEATTAADKLAKAAIEELKNQTDEATRKSDAFAKSLQGQIDKLNDLYPKEYDAVVAKYDYQKQTEETMIAVGNLNTTLGDHKATQEEVKTATDNAKDAIIHQSEQFATLDGAALGSEGAIRRQIESLKAQEASLDPNSPLRQFLDQYIADLEAIPSNISTIMDLHISQGQVTTNQGDVIGQRTGVRAAGGPVSAGGNYLVGEEGPELVHMNGAGTVIPNDALGGGTAVYNLTVNAGLGTNGTDVGNQIVAIIKKYESRNGPGWRN